MTQNLWQFAQLVKMKLNLKIIIKKQLIGINRNKIFDFWGIKNLRNTKFKFDDIVHVSL